MGTVTDTNSSHTAPLLLFAQYGVSPTLVDREGTFEQTVSPQIRLYAAAGLRPGSFPKEDGRNYWRQGDCAIGCLRPSLQLQLKQIADDCFNTSAELRSLCKTAIHEFHGLLKPSESGPEQGQQLAPSAVAGISDLATCRRDALEQFDDLEEYAAELDYEKPNASAKAFAREFALRLLDLHPLHYSIYPRKRGQVTISASTGKMHVLLIIFEPDGKVSCYLSLKGVSSYKHFDSMGDITDSYLLEALCVAESSSGYSQPKSENVALKSRTISDNEIADRLSSLSHLSEEEIASLKRKVLEQFAELAQLAADLDYMEPTEAAIACARELVLRLLNLCPINYSIYPDEVGAVTIGASRGRKHCLLILCYPGGKVSCYMSRLGVKSYRHYDSLEGLPDDYFVEALADLDYLPGGCQPKTPEVAQ